MSVQTKILVQLRDPAPVALVVTDRAGLIRFVNHQTELLFGSVRDSLVGQPIQTLVPEDLWQIYIEHQDDYFADPRTRSMGLDLDLVGRQSDGNTFPIKVSLSHVETGDLLIGIEAAREREQRELALENAQRMAAIIEDSDDAIISKTPEGKITFWNPAAERMYGYSSQEVIGRSIDIIIPVERPGEMKAILARIRSGRHVDHFETVRVRKDGTTVAVSLSVSPIRDENDTIVGASTIARNVTDHKRAFEAEQRVTAIVNNSDDAILSVSLQRVVQTWNPAAEKMFGYSSEEIIGKDGRLLSADADPSEADRHLAKVVAGEHVDHFETTRLRKDGTKIRVSETVSPIRDVSGAITAVSVIFRDVSEERQTFQAARWMIESSLDALVAISPEGKITDVNDATVKVTGISREELIGTAFSACFTDPEKANDIYQRVFADGMAVDYPLTIRHRDGTVTEVLYNASVHRDASGNVLGVFAAARDVTKQNRAQKEVAVQRGKELARLAELEQFHQLTVGRELRMIELKKEIERLGGSVPDDGDVGAQR